MITKEEEKQMYEALAAYEKEEQEKWNKAKEDLNGLIHPKYFDFAEDNDSYNSEGIVEIELTDDKETNYPNQQFCRIKGTGYSRLFMYATDTLETIDETSEYEGEEIEWWVWQQTGILGDDYSGWLLLPLLDGKRYWKVNYSC